MRAALRNGAGREPPARDDREGSRARRAKREAADFSTLGPDSSIADYLPYLHSGTYGDRALAGIQKARSRQADAVALLGKMRLGDAGRALAVQRRCPHASFARPTAMPERPGEPHRGGAGDHLAAAIDLEWQMPNLNG